MTHISDADKARSKLYQTLKSLPPDVAMAVELTAKALIFEVTKLPSIMGPLLAAAVIVELSEYIENTRVNSGN